MSLKALRTTLCVLVVFGLAGCAQEWGERAPAKAEAGTATGGPSAASGVSSQREELDELGLPKPLWERYR